MIQVELCLLFYPSSSFQLKVEMDNKRKRSGYSHESRGSRRDDSEDKEIEERVRAANEMAKKSKEKQMEEQPEWISKEDEFCLNQKKVRAQIRVKEKRGTPIDLVIIQFCLANEPKIHREFAESAVKVDIRNPIQIVEELELEELEVLQKEVEELVNLESKQVEKDFWKAMIAICDVHGKKLKEADSEPRRTGVSGSVNKDIDALLSPKNHDQLCTLQLQIENKLRNGGPVDIDYWEAVLKALVVWKAKAQVRDLHLILAHKITEADKIAAEKITPVLTARELARKAKEVAFLEEWSKGLLPCEVVLDELQMTQIVYQTNLRNMTGKINTTCADQSIA
jgi:Conserved mid region of cactin